MNNPLSASDDHGPISQSHVWLLSQRYQFNLRILSHECVPRFKKALRLVVLKLTGIWLFTNFCSNSTAATG
jgi:hypothetical protein